MGMRKQRNHCYVNHHWINLREEEVAYPDVLQRILNVVMSCSLVLSTDHPVSRATANLLLRMKGNALVYSKVGSAPRSSQAAPEQRQGVLVALVQLLHNRQ
jgi:hypothetical protein